MISRNKVHLKLLFLHTSIRFRLGFGQIVAFRLGLGQIFTENKVIVVKRYIIINTQPSQWRLAEFVTYIDRKKKKRARKMTY